MWMLAVGILSALGAVAVGVCTLRRAPQLRRGRLAA
jgi:hypothetical protein